MNSIKGRFLNLIGAFKAYWWRDRYISAWTNMRLRRSVRKSKSICSPTKPLLVLSDNTVLRHATTHGSGRVHTGQFPLDDSAKSTFYAARIPIADENEIAALEPSASAKSQKIITTYEDVKFLSGIAYLAKTGAIKLCTSAVLLAEQNWQRPGRFRGYGYDDLNLLSEIELEPIDGYFPSEIGGDTSSFPYTRVTIISFLNGVEDERYKEIRSALGPKDSQDAWHIRTAEKFGALCFLTMDYQL